MLNFAKQQIKMTPIPNACIELITNLSFDDPLKVFRVVFLLVDVRLVGVTRVCDRSRIEVLLLSSDRQSVQQNAYLLQRLAEK